MVKTFVFSTFLALALLGWGGLTLAEQPPSAIGMVPELVGSLDEWSPAAGYLVMSGTRYSLAPAVEVTSSLGEALERAALERGAEIGVFVVEGRVQRVILFQ